MKYCNWQTEAVVDWVNNDRAMCEATGARARLLLRQKGGERAALSMVDEMKSSCYKVMKDAVQEESYDLRSAFIRGCLERVAWHEIASAWVAHAAGHVTWEGEEVPRDGDLITTDGMYFHEYEEEAKNGMGEIRFWVDPDEVFAELWRQHGSPKVWVRKKDGSVSRVEKPEHASWNREDSAGR